MIRRGPDKRPRARRGEVQRWLASALSSETDDCLVWPFSCAGVADKPQPQATIGGRKVNVCPYVCEITHGPAPDGKSHAAHRCGNRLCVNRRHIRWTTPTENEHDKIGHGTKPVGEKMHNAKLREEWIMTILASKASDTFLAKWYGVSRQTIRSLRSGKSWKYLHQ